MANEDTPTLDDLPEDAPLDQVRAALNRERERRKAAEEGTVDVDRLRRENAFLKAGVPSDSKLGVLFQKGYDGELDPEAIATAWSEVAPTPADPAQPPPQGDATPPEEPPQGLTAEQQEELRRLRSGLGAETSPPGSEPRTALGKDVMDAAFEAQGGVRARPQQGMSDKALNAGFSRVFARANDGDPEAIFKRPDETWGAATERWRRSQS